ncbi:MAG: SigE family RNA polymerase sigma factor [Actinomycetota bacterium]
MRNPAAEGLEALVAERGDQLMRAALALSGSRPEGEDLLQEALERLMRNWRRVDDPEGYLRRTLYNLAADGWRRRGRWRSRMPLVQASWQETAADATAAVDLRDELVRALSQLPPQQRTVVVLRYWEQRTEAETAAILGCSEGAVKSAASRGLQRLRDLTAAWPDPGDGPGTDLTTTADAGKNAELTQGRR